MQEQEVAVAAGLGEADDGVGDGELAPAVDHPHSRTLSGEVEVGARSCEPAELNRAQMLLQYRQGERPDTAHVDPGPQHRYRARVDKLRYRLDDLERSYPHWDIVSQAGYSRNLTGRQWMFASGEPR